MSCVGPRQEHHPHAVVAKRRQGHALCGHHRAEEVIGDLHEQTGPITRIGLGAAGPAVVDVDQHFQRLTHDTVGTLPLDMCDEADPARIVLVLGIV